MRTCQASQRRPRWTLLTGARRLVATGASVLPMLSHAIMQPDAALTIWVADPAVRKDARHPSAQEIGR